MGKSQSSKKERKGFYRKELRLSRKKMHLVGVDIGSNNMQIAEINNYQIKKLVSMKLPEGAMENGKIEVGIIITDLLKKCLKNEKITTKKCSLVISNNEMIVRELKLPYMENEQLTENVYNEIQSILPLQRDEYCIDYKVLECMQNEETGDDILRLLVAAVPTYIVRQYMTTLRKAGLYVEYVDVFPSIYGKLEKWIESKYKDEPGNVCYIDFGATVTQMCLIRNGNYVVHKNIPTGGVALTNIIANEMYMDFKNAEDFKAMLSLANEHENDSFFTYVKEYYNNIITEIESTLYYYKSINGNRGIDKVYILGGGSKMPGLKEYLGNQFSIPVENLDERLSAMKPKSMQTTNIDEYVNAIACTMREEWTNV